MDFGLGKRNQRRCTLSCNRCFSTVLSVVRVTPSDSPFLCSHFWLGYSLSKSLYLFLVLLFCTRLRIFTLSLRVRLSSHLLHSELMHGQIKPAQRSVRGTCKGTAAFQACQCYFGKPLWHFGAYLLWSWCTHTCPACIWSEAVAQGRQRRCRVELCRVGTPEERLFEGELGHAGYARCGLQQRQTSLMLVSPLRMCLEETCQLTLKTAVENKIRRISF